MGQTAAIIKSYEISNSQQDILDVIIKSATANQSILWQSHNDHRTVYPVTALSLDLKARHVALQFAPSSAILNVKAPVYVKLAFRETVFKGRVLKAAPGQLQVHIPEEIHWRDFRENKRMHFRRGERFVVARPYFAHLRADQVPTMKVSLRDISENGIGIYISSQNVDFFKVDKFIELVAVGELGLMKPLLGHIRWVRKTDTKAERDEGLDWRVGIMMADPIPTHVLDPLKGAKVAGQRLQGLLESDILSGEFKEMLHSEMQRTLKKMKQRPAIARYLQELELIRGEDTYLNEHIQVLSVVCTFVARAMNWVSEASMEKFIYAAYMHDAPLFAHPRLARLKDRVDLEAAKSQLTSEEIDIYLHAPEEAAKIALGDSSAPPDVASMLAQQKELPDGSGFPRGITQAKITPMSALFIIAHSLTDAIMDDGTWDMGVWLKKAKTRFKGGHFIKVLTALEDTKITFKRR